MATDPLTAAFQKDATEAKADADRLRRENTRLREALGNVLAAPEMTDARHFAREGLFDADKIASETRS